MKADALQRAPGPKITVLPGFFHARFQQYQTSLVVSAFELEVQVF